MTQKVRDSEERKSSAELRPYRNMSASIMWIYRVCIVPFVEKTYKFLLQLREEGVTPAASVTEPT